MRSLELATQAFQDPGMPGPSHDWHVQPVVKDQIRIPPERRVSVELPALESTGCPRNLCHLHGLFRRVETNLSKVPQPFSIRQPAAYIFRADVDFSGASPLHFADENAHREKLLFKELLRRSLRLAKPFRAWVPASADLL